jgi:hypothetical protein
MKTIIRDSAALASLSWVDLKSYLDAEGWHQLGEYAEKASMYTHADSSGRVWEVLVPLRDDVADYAERMGDAIHAVAHVEARDVQAVFADLSSAGTDVIRLRAPLADDDGSIKLTQGVAMYREAENLMLAAACAAREPRRLYHARKIAEVRDYLDSVRLGQTERGSYVVTVRSPVGPALRAPSQLPLWDEEDEPFPRAVTLKLSQALQSATVAIRTAIESDRFEAFEAAVEQGVNANLCDALAQLAANGGGLDVRISWARVRPAPTAERHFRFSRDMARVLESAAQEFRRNEPKLDEQLEGFVIHLDRAPEQSSGSATLRVLLDGRSRRLRANFEPREYSLVVRAHDAKLPVSVEGDIFPSNQRWELRNPRNLRVLTDAGEPEEIRMDTSQD